MMLRRALLRVWAVVPEGTKRRLAPTAEALKMLQRRPRGYRNYLFSTLSEKLRSPLAYGKPVSITIEPANICNLRCPVCETGAGILERPPRIMPYDDFVKIMNKVGPGANHVLFYYMGEPFLNKDAYRMIRYARDMGLYVTTCTNGEEIDPDLLYESGINHISFQIGGISQATHQVYRRGGNLARQLDVLAKYLQIIRTKGKRPGEHRVELGFIVMKHNEHELDDFRTLAKELGVDCAVPIAPTVRTPEQGSLYFNKSSDYWIFDRQIFENEHRLAPIRYLPPNTCPWLNYAITIQVNGDIVPCCRDPHGKYIMGNLLKQSLDEVWNGFKFRAFRRGVYTDQSKVEVCRLCPREGAPAMW